MKKIELQHSEITNVSKIVCEDKGNGSKSKITFLNINHKWFFKTLIDGGVYNDKKNKKCDYKLEKYCGEKSIAQDIEDEYNSDLKCGVQYYVELKGENIDDAIPQLENTIMQLYNGKTESLAFIVFSNKSPNSATKNMQIEKAFLKKNKIHLIIKRTPYEYKLP